MINTEGVLTLLLDLLTKEEECVDDYTREHRFNIPLLVYRLFLLPFYQICVGNYTLFSRRESFR